MTPEQGIAGRREPVADGGSEQEDAVAFVRHLAGPHRLQLRGQQPHPVDRLQHPLAAVEDQPHFDALGATSGDDRHLGLPHRTGQLYGRRLAPTAILDVKPGDLLEVVDHRHGGVGVGGVTLVADAVDRHGQRGAALPDREVHLRGAGLHRQHDDVFQGHVGGLPRVVLGRPVVFVARSVDEVHRGLVAAGRLGRGKLAEPLAGERELTGFGDHAVTHLDVDADRRQEQDRPQRPADPEDRNRQPRDEGRADGAHVDQVPLAVFELEGAGVLLELRGHQPRPRHESYE